MYSQDIIYLNAPPKRKKVWREMYLHTAPDMFQMDLRTHTHTHLAPYQKYHIVILTFFEKQKVS